MQRTLGAREREIVHEAAVAGKGLRPDSGEGWLDVVRAELRHISRGGPHERAAQGRMLDLSRAHTPPAPEHAPAARPGERVQDIARPQPLAGAARARHERRRTDEHIAVDAPRE